MTVHAAPTSSNHSTGPWPPLTEGHTLGRLLRGFRVREASLDPEQLLPNQPGWLPEVLKLQREAMN